MFSTSSTNVKTMQNSGGGITTDPNTGTIYFTGLYGGTLESLDPFKDTTTHISGDHTNSGEQVGTLSQAMFTEPRGICLDTSSTPPVVYLVDSQIQAIFKTDIAGDQVTKLAGGHGESNGPLVSARFNFPRRCVVDETATPKTMYITESHGKKVRKIDLEAGVVSNLVTGGAGFIDGSFADAKFEDLEGIDLDTTTQKLYVVDYQNAAIRMIDIAAQVVTTLAAGTAASIDGSLAHASFAAPWSLTLDKDMTPPVLYIGSKSSNKIRAIDLATKTAHTVLSSNLQADDITVATKTLMKTLYITQYGPKSIHKVSTQNRVVALQNGGVVLQSVNPTLVVHHGTMIPCQVHPVVEREVQQMCLAPP